MAWTDYSLAPAPGTILCPRADIRGALSLVTGGFPLLLVEDGSVLRAYVNACPHQYLPLDHLGGRLVSQDGRHLMCSVHGAMFDIRTGSGVGGMECGLDPVPVTIADGMVLIAPEA